MALKSSHRRFALLVAFSIAAWALWATSASAAPVTAGFRDFSYGTTASAPTADKPQSKLWFHDGRWWGVLFNSTTRRFEIYGFNRATQDSNAWTSTGTVVDVRRTSQSDVRATGDGKAYIVSHLKAGSSQTDTAMTMRRFGYTPGSSPGTGTWALETSRNVSARAVESATIDRDSRGKLWITWTDANGPNRRAVFITHTVTTDTDFVTPYILPAANADNLKVDDISTLVASGGKIGVLYSNQTTSQLQFATHADSNPDDRAWTTTTLCATAACPDDHLNIKDLDGAGGHAYAVVKTSLNDTGGPGSAPLIVLYHVDMATLASDSHTVWRVADDVTRAITVLDRGGGEAYVFGAAPCCSGGIVYMKRAPVGSLSFATGLGTPFIQSAQDPKVNNPTSTKQSVDGTTGLLVVAGDDSTRFYLHNFLSLGGGGGGGGDTTPPTVTATSPASGATGVAVGTNVTATFSEPMDAATVPGSFTLSAGGSAVQATVTYDATTRRATLDPAADLAPGTTYTARVSGAKDVAGNTVTAATWTFTTASGGGPPPAGIARETVSTVVTSTAAASVTIPTPAGTAAGDVLVACLALNGGQVTASGVPAGWSPIASNVAIANPHIFGYYRVAGSAEPANHRWTLSSSVTSGAGIARYSGVSGSTPLDAPPSSASGAATATPTVPGITTATAGAMLVGCMAMNSSSTTNTIGSPSGMTEAWDIGGKRHELADGLQASAGPTGSKAWTFNAAREWAGWLAALRPR